MITEWTETQDQTFADAVQYMADDMQDGYSFEFALFHNADLFGIDENALRHEWNLRKDDIR